MFKRSCIVRLAPVNIRVIAPPLPSFLLLSFRSNWEARHTLNIIVHVAGKSCPLKKDLRCFKWTRRSHVESYGPGDFFFFFFFVFFTCSRWRWEILQLVIVPVLWPEIVFGDHAYALAELLALCSQQASFWACTLNTVQGRRGKNVVKHYLAICCNKSVWR